MKKRYRRLLFKFLLAGLCLLSFPGGHAHGAACCGGAAAVPAVITGDDAAQVSASFSYGSVSTDVFASGIWKKRSSPEDVETFRFEGAHIFADRWQAGGSVPVVRRVRNASDAAGLGDVSMNLGYEYLPDWDYNPWRPKGVGFLTITLPTGKSVFESSDPLALDARGRGFWALGLGTILMKSFGKWDASLALEAHRAFAKTTAGGAFQGRLRPGYGGIFSSGAGYSYKDLHFGAALSWNYEDPVKASGSISSDGSVQRFATGSLSLTYLWQRVWSSTLSYADQTLFGSPVNASLSKSVSVSLQKRWER